MSTKKQPKNYIVRGFDVRNEAFNSTGKIEDKTTFTEVVATSQAAAIVALLSNPTIKKMSSTYVKDLYDDAFGTGQSHFANLNIQNSDTSEVNIINLTICTDADSVRDLRPAKTQLREVLKLWAEKSRVRGVRGFRANAIKEPTFERSNDGIVQVRTQVIVSNAVFYNQDTVTIGLNSQAQDLEDINNLVWHLRRIDDLQFTDLHFRCSIGDGVVS